MPSSTAKALDFDFYPRPPRGGRRRTAIGYRLKGIISIHALREEGDAEAYFGRPQTAEFLSTPSARRATGFRADMERIKRISIHALREEGDIGTSSW